MSKIQPLSLIQLLNRPDIWQGKTQVADTREAVDSGYSALNQALLGRGWPTRCLIEVCQHYHACEWWLFHPLVKRLLVTQQQYIALLNPPALPFISGLAEMGILPNQLMVIQATDRQDFSISFKELCNCSAFPLILAWQPTVALNYAQLRKLQLSALEGSGVCVIFRHHLAQAQSSPASLRLSLQPELSNIHIRIFKQRGGIQQAETRIAIPSSWQKLIPDDTAGHKQSMTCRATGVEQSVLFPQIDNTSETNKYLRRDFH